MEQDRAACGDLGHWLGRIGRDLDDFLKFEHGDAMARAGDWQAALACPLPERGVGIEAVTAEIGRWLIANGSQIPNPASSAFITTGATTVGALATAAGAIAAPQRIGLTAFNFLEELSLDWLAELFELPAGMKGLYSSGGSVANLVALGTARQAAFEVVGRDPARDGIDRPGRVFATAASHHTIRRAAAVLGLGRDAVRLVDADECGRMRAEALRRALAACDDALPVAVVANAGTTNAGAIDDLAALGDIAREHRVWFHVDGAYGLPGILDPEVRPLYRGLELADSVIVDPHKWLGAPVGIGATFVRDRSLMARAFTQTAADYLEGACEDGRATHSMDSLGIPYADFGVELSAPCRGAVVWALLREIGREGLRERICRHNAMARHVACRADAHPELEVLQRPTLSICCFRYRGDGTGDLDALNQRLYREMVRRGRAMPSTTVINGRLAIRPCFVGARATMIHADELVDEVIAIGRELCAGDAALAASGPVNE
ncbi:MAG: aminotransferase class V-fold PLP-dependent enzyme [Rhodocyclaceae bacterium]|nr:aminotransferase class V-fold PLP-dependent enzyme [Rhodocyclaceae bacterium]